MARRVNSREPGRRPSGSDHRDGAARLAMALLRAEAGSPDPQRMEDVADGGGHEPPGSHDTALFAEGEGEHGNTLQTYLREIRRAPLR